MVGVEQMHWIPMSKQMPPDTDEEIFLRKLDCTEWQQTPANEIWLDISIASAYEWEWAYWKTIKNETHTK